MTSEQATEMLAWLESIDQRLAASLALVEYVGSGAFWMLCWILSALLWRNFILAKNQRNFFIVFLAFSGGASATAQNYQMSGIVFESSVVFDYDSQGNATSFQHFWEATIGGAESVSYYIGWENGNPAGETFTVRDRTGANEVGSAANNFEVVLVDGVEVKFSLVRTVSDVEPTTDVASMWSTAYALPANSAKVSDRRWCMMRFPSSGLNINVSNSPLDVPASPVDDPDSEHYGLDLTPDQPADLPTESTLDLEAFVPLNQPAWEDDSGISSGSAFLFPPGGELYFWVNPIFDFGASFYNYATGQQVVTDGFPSWWPVAPAQFRPMVRGGLLVGVVMWFVSSVLCTLRQY